MTYFEVIHETQSLPSGFDSYSLLLFPDRAWPEQAGADTLFELASRFKAFGDSLGPTHLASWPYHGIQTGHQPRMDYEVCSLVYGFTTSQEELENFVAERSRELRTKRNLWGEYHLERARLLCALYDLSFTRGPYIAFFSKRPHVPTVWSRSLYGWYPEDTMAPSIPDFVIRFGGVEFTEAVTLLNALELELLSGRRRITKLKAFQAGMLLTQACKRIGSSLRSSLDLVKTAKEIVGGG
ncbi:MAG TPA: hypothetical protein VF179_24145 [Thermoanaerobaculia bacterium]|nr:hypothetical protein [Thermoanaerobaculia bacterium]